MKKLISFLKFSMIRWWFMITAILTVSSTCSCCGKPACPIGPGAAAGFQGTTAVKQRGSIEQFFHVSRKEYGFCGTIRIKYTEL
ncbi:MAG: hypothetical protein PHC33_02710 [Candidatus Omnitrophica bacterium]|nr:hypothetical protein [Candidatus Omnitrophota bacterium]